jgi:hypothetical protein
MGCTSNDIEKNVSHLYYVILETIMIIHIINTMSFELLVTHQTSVCSLWSYSVHHTCVYYITVYLCIPVHTVFFFFLAMLLFPRHLLLVSIYSSPLSICLLYLFFCVHHDKDVFSASTDSELSQGRGSITEKIK